MDCVRLVNREHRLPHEESLWTKELVWIDHQTQLQPVCARALNAWISACGGEQEVTFVSGWRSYAQQHIIMKETEAERGWDYAHQFVAEVRASEHHTGLAIDLGIAGKDQDLICPDFSGPLAEKMHACAARFGFILRYPKQKTKITGISEEPWHYRYVGPPHAQIMNERDWVLEEYAEFLRTCSPSHPYLYFDGQQHWALWTQSVSSTVDDGAAGSLLDETTRLIVQALDPAPVAIGKDRAWVELDSAALRHNLITLEKAMTDKQKIMAVLKANAYGHGLAPIAQFLSRQGVDHFAVATMEEAKVIRDLNPDAEILILGYVPACRAQEVSELKLSLTLTSYQQACQLSQTGYPITAHLPVDTGMHRLGEAAQDLDALARYYQLPNIKITGTYSHLYEADNLSPEAQVHTQAQIERFFAAIDGLKHRGIDPGRVHLQGSYGFLNYPELRCDLVRCGIALFGCIADHRSQTKLDLRPVASVHTRIAALRSLKKGEGAGYNHVWSAPQDTTAAILSIGYSDGLLRSSSFQGVEVLIHGQRCPLVGAMCMDQCFVDIGSLPAVIGEEVIVIGTQGTQSISALEIADRTGTIVPETLSLLRGRMPRIFI